jgi:hypothetical protein
MPFQAVLSADVRAGRLEMRGIASFVSTVNAFIAERWWRWCRCGRADVAD